MMMMMNFFVIGTLMVSFFSHLCSSQNSPMLGSPFVVSGVVFDDWNDNGKRDLLEPGVSSVLVSLWYLPAGSYSVLSNASYVQVGSYYTKLGTGSSEGQFQFTCLSAGMYTVGLHLSSTRPSKVTTGQTVSGTMAWTSPFEATSAGSTDIQIGLSQVIFAVAFSLTSAQTVPPTSASFTGAAYGVLNLTDPALPEMYFRIVRGALPIGYVEQPGGFYLGWSDQVPGTQVRSLADTSDVKENVWFIQTNPYVQSLLEGETLVQLTANSSSIRGQFSRFRRGTYLQSMIPLTGASVVPLVSTSVRGSATFVLDLTRAQLNYQINYSPLPGEVETMASLNGPALIGQNGPVIYTLPLGPTKVGALTGLSDTFMSWLTQSMVYVTINTNKHPNGLLRGQIRSWQQTQYQSVINLQPQAPPVGTLNTFAQAVAQIDLQLQTFTYYILYGGMAANELSASIVSLDGGSSFPLEGDVLTAYDDGVKQGFFSLTTDQINAFFQGQYQYVINSQVQKELVGVVNNWN